MGTSIIVVDDKLDDVIISQNLWIGVHTINSWVGGILTNTQNCSKSWYFLGDVSDIVPGGSEIGVSNAANEQKKWEYLFWFSITVKFSSRVIV